MLRSNRVSVSPIKNSGLHAGVLFLSFSGFICSGILPHQISAESGYFL